MPGWRYQAWQLLSKLKQGQWLPLRCMDVSWQYGNKHTKRLWKVIDLLHTVGARNLATASRTRVRWTA
eukprot:scaffold190222_cov18-Prasinocladus_malaysianus.AAC.1